MASSSLIPEITLNSGKKIPAIGFGTASFSASKAEEVAAVVEAIARGYRHFDTAYLYGSEEGLGEGIAEALKRGLIKSRQELFITSKIWCSDAHPDLVVPGIHKSLEKLKLDYLDLYLLHFPVSATPGNYDFPIKAEDLLPLDYKNVWASMEECTKLGLAKSIGISNFSCKKTEQILAVANIPPAVNQVELNPCWQQKKLVDFCKSKGIVVTSYSPLGSVGTFWGSNKVMDNEVLKQIAKSKGKSVAQIVLRWAHEQGIVIVVKSYNPERMVENRSIFDFELTEEEHKMIREIPQYRAQRYDFLVSENGPIKSLEELWDGEL